MNDRPAKNGIRVLPAVMLLATQCLADSLGPVPQWFGTPPSGYGEQFSPEVPPVNAQDRQQVVAAYYASYLASEDVPMDWSGDVSTCSAGTNSPLFKEAIIRRVNYFRAMAGLPGTVTLDESWSTKCQQAALMMAAQGALSHQPDPTWECYTTDGAEAAGKSNLYHGRSDASAIDGYIDDWGAANYFVGHRRWILYPPARVMGTGSILTAQGILGANALWVVGGFGARPPQPTWVAWPPKGYVPYQLLPRVSRRWSFSLPGADFRSAQVLMTCSGTNLTLVLETLQNDHGYADNTLVWIPVGVSTTRPSTDVAYDVNVKGVIVAGVTQDFEYSVTVIDPSAPLLAKPLTLAAGVTNLLAGGEAGLPLVLDSTVGVTNVSFVLETDAQRLTNLSVQAAAPEIISTQVIELAAGRLAVSLRLDPALWTASNRTIAMLGFSALTNRGSAIVPVTLSQLQAWYAGGIGATRTATGSGGVIVVEHQPVLLLSQPESPALTLFGLPGRGYALLAATNAGTGAVWQEFHRQKLTGLTAKLSSVVLPEAPRFFRALEIPGDLSRLELFNLGEDRLALRFEGLPGESYTVQTTHDLANRTVWSNVTTLVLTNPTATLYWTNQTESRQFFRARHP